MYELIISIAVLLMTVTLSSMVASVLWDKYKPKSKNDWTE